jgi:uncharacterized protein with beta-barrel porin domain
LLGALQTVSTSDELSRALAALSPAAYNGLSQVALKTVSGGRASLGDRMSMARAAAADAADGSGAASFLPGGHAIQFFGQEGGGNAAPWLSYSSRSGALADGVNGYGRVEFETRSSEIGFDLPVGDYWMFGASVADFDSIASMLTTSSIGRIEGQRLSMFAAHFVPGGAYVQAGISVGRNDYSTIRGIDAGVLRSAARADYAGRELSGFVEIGRATRFGPLASELYGAIEHASVREDGFVETGAAAARFAIDARETRTTSVELGWRSAWDFETSVGRLTPRLNLAGVHDIDVVAPQLTGRLGGSAVSTLELPGAAYSSDGVRAGFGLDYARGDTATWSLRWSGERRSDYSDSSVLLQFNTRF